MKADDLRNKSLKILEELENQKRLDLFKLKMKHYSGQLLDVSQIKKAKRDVARILTAKTEQKILNDIKELVSLSNEKGIYQDKAKTFQKYSDNVSKLSKSDKMEINKILSALKNRD